MNLRIKNSVALLAASALVLTGSLPAVAAQNNSATELAFTQATEADLYSDYDVISFLALGVGQVADDHEALAPYTLPSAEVTAENQQEITDLYLKAAPDFNERVTEPLQSGDPRLAEQALSEFGSISYVVAEDLGIDVSDEEEYDTFAAIIFVVVVVAVAGLVAATVAAAANVRTVWNTVDLWGASVGVSAISNEKRAAAFALALGH